MYIFELENSLLPFSRMQSLVCQIIIAENKPKGAEAVIPGQVAGIVNAN